jgi:hypothetical protein
MQGFLSQISYTMPLRLSALMLNSTFATNAHHSHLFAQYRTTTKLTLSSHLSKKDQTSITTTPQI